MGHKSTSGYRADKAMAVIAALEHANAMGAAPILSIAAEYCGQNPEVVERWYVLGQQGDRGCEHFYVAVARIKANWKIEVQNKIATAGKDEVAKVNGLKYLLQCADREVFDLTKRAAAVKPSAQREPPPMDLNTALAELTPKEPEHE